MLRPKQLLVAEVPVLQSQDANACYGTVLDADFGGAVTMLSVRLLTAGKPGDPPDGAAVADLPLLVHSPGQHAPPEGAIVHITVAGQAHVFAGSWP